MIPGHTAPCGDEFDTDRDAQDHAHYCGACAGVPEKGEFHTQRNTRVSENAPSA